MGWNTRYCCVCTCINSSSLNKNLAFFTLPRDPIRRAEWLRLIWREDLTELTSYIKNYRVCADHFTGDCFVDPNQRKMLTANALPSLCLPQKGPTSKKTESRVSIFTQTSYTTPTEINFVSNTSRKRKYTKNFSEPYSKAVLNNLMKTLAPLELNRLYKTREMIQARSGERQFDENYKIFCLNLYYASQKSYHIFQNLLGLPNITVLYQDIPVTTDINKDVLSALQFKVANMTDLERRCIMLIDNMTLTPQFRYDENEEKINGLQEINGVLSSYPANKAVVVILHGIFTKWRLPVGYALLSECGDANLSGWVIEIIKALSKIGFNINIINFTNATELESNFFEKCRVSVDAPFCYVDDMKIYNIHDTRVLLKLLRDCLSLNDIQFNNRKAKYEHIVNFYNNDAKMKFKLAPNLTDSHIWPTSSEKDKTSYAVELISRPVACGLSAYIDLQVIEEAGRDTVEFITKINDLCECLASTNSIDKNKRLIYGDDSKLWFLKEMIAFFQGLKVMDSKTGEDVTLMYRKLIHGFQITIHAMLRLLEDMKDYKEMDVPMQTFSEGVTDEFIKQLRAKFSFTTDLSAFDFIIAYKNLFLANLIKPPKKQDHRKFFSQLNRVSLLNNDVNTRKKNRDTNVEPYVEGKLTIPFSDYNYIDRADRHTLIYVSGYLLNKCKEKHGYCKTYTSYLKASSLTEYVSSRNITLRYEEYSKRNKLSLMTVPCDNFVYMVEQMEEKFRNKLRQRINRKLEEALYLEIIKTLTMIPCRCFPKAYLTKLFIRIRINYTVQLNNRELARNSKHFVIPLLL